MQISYAGKVPSDRNKVIFNNHPLDYTNTYKYLGVLFDSTGNVNPARENMRERGQKALFKLKSVIDREFFLPKLV